MSDFQHSLHQALDPGSSQLVGHRARIAMRMLIGVGLAVTTLRLIDPIAGGRRTGRAAAVGRCMLLMLDIADFHGLAVNQPELSAAIRERAVGRAERS
jgi:hypothetical protein